MDIHSKRGKRRNEFGKDSGTGSTGTKKWESGNVGSKFAGLTKTNANLPSGEAYGSAVKNGMPKRGGKGY